MSMRRVVVLAIVGAVSGVNLVGCCCGNPNPTLVQEKASAQFLRELRPTQASAPAPAPVAQR
jgi:hypothetical protein